MANEIWVCANNANHIFDMKTAEEKGYFCPECAYGEGILIPKSDENNVVTSEDLGLCIMLLDCSGSMVNPAFPNSPLTKRQIIARSVAAGVFSLSGNLKKQYAYMLIIGFDFDTEILIPFLSIDDIINKYHEQSNFESALLEKMPQRKGYTDINKALALAYKFTQEFINSDISALGNYKPSSQTVFDSELNTHLIPNVRVLLFTDGEQYLGEDEDNSLHPSPFKNLTYNGKYFDLLMSAYYGSTGDEGYKQLKSLVSKCPRHENEDQFFLFDNPSKVANLKNLFRMASGASGFCPLCQEEATRNETKIQ